MRHPRCAATFAAAVVLAPFFTATAPVAVASNDPAVDAPAIGDFVELTDRYLEQRADAVTVKSSQVDARFQEGAMAVPTTDGLRQKLAAEYQQLAALAAEYKELDGGYVDAAVTVTPQGPFSQTETTVRLQVTEDTKLYHPTADVAAGAPEAEEYSINHTLTFNRDDAGTWRLASDLADTGSMPPSTYMAEPRLDLEIPGEDSGTPDEPEDDKTEMSSPTGESTPGGESKPAQALAGYSYDKMAAYANKYWKNNNDAYRRYGNDCTNFISQAMRAGGWKYNGDRRRHNSSWFYGSTSTIYTSYTWAGAENWYWFAKKWSKRTRILPYVQDLAKADVLQADFDRNNNINHTMIVTKGWRSNSYLSYHTPNVHNRSLKKILRKYPRAWWYAHRT
ncbi:amidase domain-containing protein [Streptomyces sp. NPDC050732]|uniref:amidase domain-containing protein n=1 Tax=Streptomyces sp. NPDC050732 TaxID=3154632 RepID=UPI003445CB0D